MGRNKFTNQVGRNEIKRDKKNKELGLPDNKTGRLQSVGAYYSTGSASPYTHTVGIASTRRTALDTRRSAKSDSQFQFVAAPGSHGQDTYRFWEAVALGAVPVTLRGPLDGLYSQVPCVLVMDWRRPITPADLVAWRQNLTERFGDLNAATRTARRTVLNSTFWAEQIRSMA